MATNPRSFEAPQERFEEGSVNPYPQSSLSKMRGKEVSVPEGAAVVTRLAREIPEKHLAMVVDFVRSFPNAQREEVADKLLEKLKGLPEMLRMSKTPVKDLTEYMGSVKEEMLEKYPETGQ